MRSRWGKVLCLLFAFTLVAAACGDDDDDDAGGEDTETTDDADGGDEGGGDEDGGDEGGDAEAEEVGADFTLFGAPTGVEGDAMSGFIDVYNEATGSSIEFTGSDDFESQLRIRVDGGDPPAVAFTPQPASICAFADEGALVSLEDMGFDIAQMEADHSEFWMNLGLCEDGNHYGIPWFPNFKSVVFYHAPTFEEMGYEVPETYEDMVSLSQTIVDDGMTPWCFGFESGGATGWPGTDWIEDIYLRLNGADMYSQWYQHEIPFDDPSVVSAFDTMGEIFFGEGFVLGGPDGVSGVNFNDSPGPLFQDPPGCLMLKQGSFISNVFGDQPDYEDGEESEIEVFSFPTIDGNGGAMGGGDTLIVFDDAEANVQAVMDWITPEWQCTLASASGGGVAPYGGHGVEGVERLPGNANVDPACYETDASRTFAETITEALGSNTFVFDASDLMPAAVGQGTFWTAMIDWSGGAPAEEVTATVESSWP
ncbi:MAG: ABC transporter substrate-binding protein [Actinomycetota bacterium]|nr:ABC transporter substrate-binding protein [Actinomycetota bacterium]